MIMDGRNQERTVKCPHKKDGDKSWCEPCFRKDQRERWGYSPHDYCDHLGRTNG